MNPSYANGDERGTVQDEARDLTHLAWAWTAPTLARTLGREQAHGAAVARHRRTLSEVTGGAK